MTTDFVGADVDGLRELAKRLERGAAVTRETSVALRQQLTSIRWQGPDRDRFHQRELVQLQASFRAATASLVDLGTKLRSEADQQQTTSAELGGIAGIFDDLFGGGSKETPPSFAQQVADTRAGMQRDLDDARRRLDELKEKRQHVGGIGNWIADHNAWDESESEKLDRQIREEEARINRLTALLKDPDRQFLKVDASGDGRIIEVYGDLASADRIAIHVPGMSTSIDSYIGGNGHTDASALYNKLGDFTAAGGERVAVISFLDWDAPDGIEGSWTDPGSYEGKVRAGAEAVGEGLAEKGADSLRSFVSDLNSQGIDSSKVTVVAHSYGSVVTGLALRDGLDVERAVVIGSPGLGQGIGSYADLNTDADLWVGATRDDYVVLSGALGGHGTSPYWDDFGGQQFDTSGSSGHSEYFEGQSINNIAGIVLGDFD